MYKGILFDLDGTLADSVDSLAIPCNKALEACGLQPQESEKYKLFAGDGPRVLVQRALMAAGDMECENFEKVYQIYRENFTQNSTLNVKAYDGLEKTLGVIKEAGIKLGVVTNKPQKLAVEVVEELFGKDFFDCVVGFNENVPQKPDPAQVMLALGKLDLKKEDCMYVGDTDVDMKTGNGAGLFTVGVLWGFRTKEELEKHQAHATIEEPKELLSFLKL